MFGGDIQPEFCAYSWSGNSSRITAIGKLTMVVFIVLVVEAAWGATGLNADGIALLEFKKAITSDPQNALHNWNGSDATPCIWTGISCRTIQGLPEQRVVDITLPR